MVIPIPSLFMPLPLPMMIPFMAAQSAALALAFGENFQYGKRRISAMSNEEFNKLTPITLSQRAQQEMQALIPTLTASMKQYNETMTPKILEMFGRMVRQLQELALETAETAGENILEGVQKTQKEIDDQLLHLQGKHLTGYHTTTVPTVDTDIGELPKILPETEPVPTTGGTSTEQPPLEQDRLYTFTFTFTGLDGNPTTRTVSYTRAGWEQAIDFYTKNLTFMSPSPSRIMTLSRLARLRYLYSVQFGVWY